MTNLSNNATEAQPGESLDLLGLLTEVLVMGCLEKQGDSRQLHHERLSQHKQWLIDATQELPEEA